MHVVDPYFDLPEPIQKAFRELYWAIEAHASDHGHIYASESDGPNSPDYENTAQRAYDREREQINVYLTNFLNEGLEP